MTGKCIQAAVGAAAALALTVPMAAPAGAVPRVSEPIVSGLVGPLGLAVGGYGELAVAQSFAGALTTVQRDGSTEDLVAGAPGAIWGVAAGTYGSYAYTFAGGDEQTGPIGTLNQVTASGRVTVLADTWAYEQRVNPDANSNYGFQGLSNFCASRVPEELGGGKPFGGIVESNPYAVARSGGTYYVADAAANAILKVDAKRRVSTAAVLPPVPLTITAEAAASLRLPRCTVGKTFNFEPVPTDVEIGPDGALYVSGLPGGPEDPSLGARGVVFRVDPSTGAVRRIGSGLFAATDLAVGPDGKVYVAELFGGRVSVLQGGRPVTVAELPTPGAVEYSRGSLYVTTDALPSDAAPPDGKIVRIRL